MGTQRPGTARQRAPRKSATSNRQATKAQPSIEQPLVRLAGLKKAFGKRTVVNDVNLAVGPGDLVEITGPSGSGKTTMLRLIHGQLRPSAGEVWVEGRGLHRWWRRDLDRVRRDVAFIFQEQRLLPRLTAFENVVLGLTVNDPTVPHSAIKRRALAALEGLGVAERRSAFPGQLSAGERQRVAVARALAPAPRVVLADEPFTSIDRENAQAVARMLEEAAAHGTAVVVATHHPTGRARRVVSMPQGTVVDAKGRPAPANGAKLARAGWKRLLEASIPLTAKSGNANGHANGHQNGHANGNGHASGNGHANGHIRGRATRTERAAVAGRKALALVANSFRLVVLGGLRSWRRDLRFNAPAMQTMALLLVMCGLLALVTAAIAPAAARAETDASLVRVYLADGATQDQIDSLKSQLAADPRVASVRYVSSAEALKEAAGRPGLDTLAGLSDTNPFPASLDVKVKLVTEVSAVAQLARGDAAVDPAYPTSYDPGLYGRLKKLAIGVGIVGGALVLLLAFIAYAVAANSMRATAAARREEQKTLRLLGARPWMLRDPFIVEGLMTGAVAGAVAGALVGLAWLLASSFARSTFIDLLPGVGLTAARDVIAGVIVAGMILGILTSLLSFRRVRG